MAYPYDDNYSDWEAHVSARHACRNCGRLSLHLNLEDGWCPRCNGDDDEAQVREANEKAWDKFYRQHPRLKP